MPTANFVPEPDAICTFSAWVHYFQTQTHWNEELPWNDAYCLTAEEKSAVTASLQQFQLGEGSAGSGLHQRGQQLFARCGDASYGEATHLFVAEEQRHSEMLGRFMDLQGIPRLHSHWVDQVFRRFRRVAGLELCIRVLVTAEIIAVPFYQALGNATQSLLLKALCERILQDEHEHLRFQAATLGRLRDGRGLLAHSAWKGFHSCFVVMTALLVWQQHRRTLARGGFTASSFVVACWREYKQMQTWIVQALHLPKPILLPSKMKSIS